MNDMQDSGSITEYPQHRLTADIHERGIVPQPEPAPKILQGLTTGEVIARRARGFGNTAHPKISRTYVQIFIENTFTFTNNILYTLGIALVLLGQVSDALVSVGIVLSNTIVGVVQEIRAKRILDQIALLTRPQATVLRDGTEQTIDPGEVVLGDILVLKPGDQIVVDGQIVGPGQVEIDESLLTGESDLVPKGEGDRVYSGSFCIAGSSVYEAQKVGNSSFANQLTAGARSFRRISTPLQSQVNLIIRVIFLVAVLFEVLLAIDAAIENTPIVQRVEVAMVIAGLIPNGLLLAIAVTYAFGAVRMVQQGVLVQQANAIESLSNVDVLCLDKTGTLTANRIQFDAVHPIGISENDLRRFLGAYARSTTAGNRTNEAIATALGGEAHPVRDEVSFSSARQWSALAFDDADMPDTYVLGAPEVLLRSCEGEYASVIQPVISRWMARGLRVLLFASTGACRSLHDEAGQPRLPAHLVPLGIAGFRDELRPQAHRTLEDFAKAGISIKIISGDNPGTVAALAQQVGWGQQMHPVSGTELDAMDDGRFTQIVEESNIFGRITPQQKERIVQALQAKRHYVAMIGDGVNDILALKHAQLGIAMQSGSAAARGVADMILMTDSFAALPYAFTEGQRIINGMHSILKIFLARIGYATLLVLSAAIVGGFPFTPKQNSLLTLFTVGIPMLALAAWARPGVVLRHNRFRSLFSFVFPAAITLWACGLGVYLYYLLYAPTTTAVVATNAVLDGTAINALMVAQSALTTFAVCGGLLLIPLFEFMTSRSTGQAEDWRPAALAGGLFCIYAVLLAISPLRAFFDLAPLLLLDYLLIGVVALLAIGLLWLAWRRRILERIFNLENGE